MTPNIDIMQITSQFEALSDVNISITIRQMDSIVGHLTIQKKTQKYT